MPVQYCQLGRHRLGWVPSSGTQMVMMKERGRRKSSHTSKSGRCQWDPRKGTLAIPQPRCPHSPTLQHLQPWYIQTGLEEDTAIFGGEVMEASTTVGARHASSLGS